MSKQIMSMLLAVTICIAVVAPTAAQPTPFMISGYVFYENGTACNNPTVNITNTNTSEDWNADTNATSNYYKLILANGTDVNVTEILRFNATSPPDGSQSKVVNHTVNETEVNNGGLFNFNITLAPAPTGICGDVNEDGDVNMLDVIDVLYYVSYPGEYTIGSAWAADVNCDTRIDMLDVIDLLYYVSYPGEYELGCCEG